MGGNISSKVILACAGSGKTFQLTNQIIKLLVNGVGPDKILATTFTRKAAAEIEERVFIRLAKAVLEPSSLEELRNNCDHNIDYLKCATALKKLCSYLQNLRILTLDSFFLQIARCFAWELGIKSNFTICYTQDELKILEQGVIQKFITNFSTEKIVQLLSDLTGKRYRSKLLPTLSSLLKDNYEQLINYQIYNFDSAISQNEISSTEQIMKQLEDFLSISIPKTDKGTPRKLWHDAIKNHILSLERGDWENLVDKGVIKKILDNQDTYDRTLINEDLKLILKETIKIAEHNLLKRAKLKTIAFRDIYETFRELLDKAKSEQNFFTFNDIKRKISGSNLVSNFSELYFRLDTQISHILLDEFQDTSFSEWMIIKPFLEENLSKNQKIGQNTFFCVGDLKQAIYAWRGGEAQLLSSLAENQGKNYSVEYLDTTRRCSQAVVEFANNLFLNIGENNFLEPVNKATKDFAKNYKKHSALSNAEEGIVSIKICINTQADRKLEKFKETLKCIEELVKASDENTIGILFQTNREITDFAELLKEFNFKEEFSIEGGSSINFPPAVTKILSLLRFIDHPGDTVAGYAVANSEIKKLCDVKPEFILKSAAHISSDLRKEIHSTGFDCFIAKCISVVKESAGENERYYLTKLNELAVLFSPIFNSRCCDFIDFISTKKSLDKIQQRIRLLTIHSAKGLEFDTVILPDLDSDIEAIFKRTAFIRAQDEEQNEVVLAYPNRQLRLLNKQIDKLYGTALSSYVYENLCKLYVAITRAKNALYIFLESDSSSNISLGKIISTFIARNDLDNNNCLTIGGNKLNSSNEEENSVNISLKNDSELQQLINPDKEHIEFRPATRLEKGYHFTAPSFHKKKDIFNLKAFSPNTAATTYGTYIHSLMEKIDWYDDKNRNYEKEILNFLKNHNTFNIFSKSFYSKHMPGELKVYLERRFSLINEDSIVNGSLDRVVVAYENSKATQAEIIDFKTDDVSSSEVSLRAKSYQEQCRLYRWAASKLFGLPESKISVKLLFLKADFVFEVR